MRTKLKEYISLTEEEKRKIWEEGVFVLDTNVLLNLCRYSKNSSDELLSIIKKHKDNLWLPYQVAMEFFNNRIEVIEGIRSGFDGLLRNISRIDTVLETELKFKEFRPDSALNIDLIRKDISNFRKRIEAKIKRWKKEFEDNDKDIILQEILDLYDGKVGDDYKPEEIETLFKDGALRYQEKTPPGFADLKEKEKKGKRSVYGDLIWWKQVIDFAKSNKRDIIIVTDDTKDDWWHTVSGKTIGPRVELIREFDKETSGRRFLIYKTHQFMEMAKILDGVHVSDSSIREAEETGAIDYLRLSDLYKAYDQSYLNPSYQNAILHAPVEPIIPSSYYSYLAGRDRVNQLIDDDSLIRFISVR